MLLRHKHHHRVWTHILERVLLNVFQLSEHFVRLLLCLVGEVLLIVYYPNYDVFAEAGLALCQKALLALPQKGQVALLLLFLASIVDLHTTRRPAALLKLHRVRIHPVLHGDLLAQVRAVRKVALQSWLRVRDGPPVVPRHLLHVLRDGLEQAQHRVQVVIVVYAAVCVVREGQQLRANTQVFSLYFPSHHISIWVSLTCCC